MPRLAEANVARNLIDWSKQNVSRINSRINWGKGANDGSFAPVLDHGSNYSFIPFRIYTYANVEILFNRMMVRNNAPFDAKEKRLELLRRLNEIPGVRLPADGIDRRPSIPLSALVDPNALAMFLSLIEWAVEEVKAAQQH